MLVGLFLIAAGYAVPLYCHHWLEVWLSWKSGPVSMVVLHRYLAYLECLQLFLVLLGLNIAVAAFTRSKAARDAPGPTSMDLVMTATEVAAF